jgi:hypothetical protein
MDQTLFRLYESDELGADDYPPVCEAPVRCVRCGTAAACGAMLGSRERDRPHWSVSSSSSLGRRRQETDRLLGVDGLTRPTRLRPDSGRSTHAMHPRSHVSPHGRGRPRWLRVASQLRQSAMRSARASCAGHKERACEADARGEVRRRVSGWAPANPREHISASGQRPAYVSGLQARTGGCQLSSEGGGALAAPRSAPQRSRLATVRVRMWATCASRSSDRSSARVGQGPAVALYQGPQRASSRAGQAGAA